MYLFKLWLVVVCVCSVAMSAFADNHSSSHSSEIGSGDESSFKASGLVVKKYSDVTYLSGIGYLNGKLIFLDDSFGAELIDTEWALSCIYRAELSPDATIDWNDPENVWNAILVGCELLSEEFGRITAKAVSDNFQMPNHIFFDFRGYRSGAINSRLCTLNYQDAPIEDHADYFGFSARGNCRVNEKK